MIDYGMLPPEVNSTRMYAGPGSAPMLAAAAAWDVLAEELAANAAHLHLTVVDLASGPWRGPASAAMSSALLPFAAWISATSGLAAQTAGQAKAVAAAFEAAFAMTVPPPVVAANRALLHTLIATNFFGQNTPAIAATEAHYASMWAQDATAMYTYAGTAQAASQVTPFTSPPKTTNEGGLAAQSAAVTQAGANSAGQSASSLPSLAQSLSTLSAQGAGAGGVAIGEAGTTAPTVPSTPVSILTGLQSLLNPLTSANKLLTNAASPFRIIDSVGQGLNGWEVSGSAVADARALLTQTVKAAESAVKPMVSPASFVPAGPTGGAPAVTVGRAMSLGGLSVPANWPGSVPTATQQASLVASRTAALATEAETAAMRPHFGMPGLPGMPAAAAAGAQRMRFVPRYGYRHQMMQRPPSGG